MNEERDDRENEIVLRHENDKWIVYATDERASKVTNSQFVAHIILYQPKEWKMFSCSLNKSTCHFQNENSKCLKVPYPVFCFSPELSG